MIFCSVNDPTFCNRVSRERERAMAEKTAMRVRKNRKGRDERRRDRGRKVRERKDGIIIQFSRMNQVCK